MKSKKTHIFTFLFGFIVNLGISQELYFPERGNWEEKSPSEFNINSTKLNEAISYAEANEYSGSKDLRIAILKGFEREPYHKILGPTKKRGAPAGLILKDGYIIAKNNFPVVNLGDPLFHVGFE